MKTEQLERIGTDLEAFEAFYWENVEGVQRFVARRVEDRERAADLTAEIFLAAIGSAETYDPRLGPPRAWLYGIDRIDAEARSRELHAAMERLTEGERVVLELVVLDGLSVPEAAKAAGVRPVTARVRLHRARRKLRAELEGPSPNGRRCRRARVWSETVPMRR